MDSSRIKQVNELINHNISFILKDIFADEIFSITEVKTSPDLSFSKIYISVLNDGNALVDKINKHSPEIRRTLSERIKIRHTPKIRFYIDETEVYAEKIDQLFEKL